MKTIQTNVVAEVVSNDDGSNNVYITASNDRTFATIPYNTGTGENPNVFIIVDTNASIVGNELIIFYGRDNEASTPHLRFTSANKITITSCGGGEDDGYISPDMRWVGRFWYNGEIFTNTYDNC
jgi:hypothetical protein